MSKPCLIVVVGPTAVGKTDTCVWLAEQLACPVVSADSRQFYQEMQIGTARPQLDELRNVPHYFLGHLSVVQHYSVGDFERDALELLSKLFKENSTVILTGGSGLFIQAVCEGMDDIPELKVGVREGLMEEFRKNGLAPLLEELKEKDPEYYQQVDQNNHARVIRALEVIRSSGQAFSLFRKRKPKPRDFEIIKIGLNRTREVLYDRINRRVDLMMEAGLLKEAHDLIEYRQLNALQTVGYKEFFPYFDGEYSLEEAVHFLKQHSRRYAKKQLTWFKRDEQIQWFHPDEKQEIWSWLKEKLSIINPQKR